MNIKGRKGMECKKLKEH